MSIHPGTIDEQLLQEPSQVGIFLQSAAWGVFQQHVGVSVFVKQYHTQLVQVFEKTVLSKKYWYVTRARMHQKTAHALLADARLQGVVYVVLEPFRELDFAPYYNFETKPIQPHQTSVVSLGSDEDMLRVMHQKTRYNVNLAKKKGVTVIVDREGKYTEDFVALVSHTGRRNKFGTHSAAYYRACIAQRSAFLVCAIYEGTVIAAHLYWEFGDTVTYLHGGSSSEHREVMGPFGVHFTAMQESRDRGFLYYDLWGIDEKKWESLTRFKRGFGGFEITYPAASIVVLQRGWYRVISCARFLKRLL